MPVRITPKRYEGRHRLEDELTDWERDLLDIPDLRPAIRAWIEEYYDLTDADTYGPYHSIDHPHPEGCRN